MGGTQSIADVKLIAITDASSRGEAATFNAAERLAAAARPGSVVFQLRDNSLEWRQRFGIGRRLQQVAAGFGHQLCVNDRLDLALSLGATWVHLKGSSLDVQATRGLFATRNIDVVVTQALHTTDQALCGDSSMVPSKILPRPDAWLLSPVCQSRKGRRALGYATLLQASERLRAPAFALGGVRAAQVADCKKAGAQGVAVIGAFYDEPLALVRELGVERRP